MRGCSVIVIDMAANQDRTTLNGACLAIGVGGYELYFMQLMRTRSSQLLDLGCIHI